jgi:hypothetical protein
VNRVASNDEAEHAGVVNRGLVATQDMPVEHAIHWKPLRDAHYILASLQPGDGGRRKIFIRQRVLAGVQSQVRGGHGRRVAGILLGRLFQCPRTGTDYEIIDSVFVLSDARADDLLGTVGRGLSAAKQQQASQVLGWYTSTETLGFKLSSTLAAVHRSCFQDPHQTTLTITGGMSTLGGAFFLYDDAAARWFYAPFYELPIEVPAGRQPKSTCLAWPQYLTVDDVVLAELDEPATTDRMDTAPNGRDDPAATSTPPAADSHIQLSAVAEPQEPQLQISTSDAGHPTAQPDSMFSVAPALTPNDGRETPAPTPANPVERGAETVDADATEDAPAVNTPWAGDERDRSARPWSVIRGTRRVDGETGRNDPDRFIDQARSEGFVEVATFASVAKTRRAEVLRILADPSAGLLLTVVTTTARVLDATLHYNLHTDEPAVLRHAFPEHRDLSSQTVYVRETCLDKLSARCRRLRETATLERAWKVSPILYFLTPGEWQSSPTLTDPQRHAEHVQLLNRHRTSALPESIRTQFGLGVSP